MGLSEALPWLALLVGFAPVLLDLVHHVSAEPWARYILVFVPLCVVCLASCREEPRRHADGYLWLAIAIVVELVAIAGSTTRLARPAFALAVIGLCRASGLANTRTAALTFWLIPVPNLLLRMASPALETGLLGIAATAGRAAGVAVEVEGPVASAASGALVLQPWHGGLPLVALLSGLGWYASLRDGSGLAAALGRMLVWGALGLPLQALALLGAVWVLAAGAPEVGREFLEQYLWCGVAAAAIVRIEWRARRAGSLRGLSRRQGSSGGGLAS
jgi:hypothetical protein